MKVIKKDGRVQEFDSSKIYNSLRSASRDLDRATLNESDLKILVEDIVTKLNTIRKDETPSSSFEIFGVVCRVLKDDGFANLLSAYVRG